MYIYNSFVNCREAMEVDEAVASPGADENENHSDDVSVDSEEETNNNEGTITCYVIY